MADRGELPRLEVNAGTAAVASSEHRAGAQADPVLHPAIQLGSPGDAGERPRAGDDSGPDQLQADGHVAALVRRSCKARHYRDQRRAQTEYPTPPTEEPPEEIQPPEQTPIATDPASVRGKVMTLS